MRTTALVAILFLGFSAFVLASDPPTPGTIPNGLTAPSAFGLNKYSQFPYASTLLKQPIDTVWALLRNFGDSLIALRGPGQISNFYIVSGTGCDGTDVGVVYNLTYGANRGDWVLLRVQEVSDYRFRRTFEIMQNGAYPGTTYFVGHIQLERVYVSGRYDYTLFQIFQSYSVDDRVIDTAIINSIVQGVVEGEAQSVAAIFGDVLAPVAPCPGTGSACNASVSIKVSNTYQQNGKKNTQYTITLKNTGTRVINAAFVDVALAATSNITAPYNFSPNTGAVYNFGTLAAGASTSSAGFTVVGNDTPVLTLNQQAGAVCYN